MKIIHIAGGGDVGGAKTHILDLCQRLMQKHELKLVSLRGGDFPDSARERGIETITIYSRVTPRDYVDLIKLIKKEKPDIVHCHGAKANLAGVLVKRFCKIPIITTVHSDYKLDYMHSFLKQQTLGRLNAICLKSFDYYVTVSDQFKQMLYKRRFSPYKIMTIYNGLDFSVKAPKINKAAYLKKLGLDYREGDIVLGIPVRLNPVKDIPTLLRAVSLCENRHVKLLIGGEGEEKDRLVRMTRELGLENRVCFAGWITDVPEFFSACDIDVLCSISESFPYTVLEGIREGCPVIVSDVGGMRNLIDHGENGYIFTPGDSESLAKLIDELASNGEKRKRFADRLYEKASSRFSLANMADNQLNIYDISLRKHARAKRRDGVLICGAYGKNNSGDEAILKAIIQTLREVDELLPLTVMTRKPLETKLMYDVEALYTFNVPSFLKYMRRSRLFINGGGSLIQDTTSSRSLMFYLFTIWAAKHLGCKVLMYGCGIGHVRRRLNRRVSRFVLNSNVDMATLRDDASLREMEEMGVTKPEIRAAADPVLSLHFYDEARADDFLQQAGIDPEGKYISFSIRPWKNFKNYEIFARAAEYAYEKHGLVAVFIPIERPLDIGISTKVAESLKTPYHIINTPEDVSMTIALTNKMRMVCSMRLHALIFAAAARTPFIGVSYDMKVSSFIEYMGMDTCIDLWEADAQWICGQIDRVMASGGLPEEAYLRIESLEGENLKAVREILNG